MFILCRRWQIQQCVILSPGPGGKTPRKQHNKENGKKSSRIKKKANRETKNHREITNTEDNIEKRKTPNASSRGWAYL